MKTPLLHFLCGKSPSLNSDPLPEEKDEKSDGDRRDVSRTGPWHIHRDRRQKWFEESSSTSDCSDCGAESDSTCTPRSSSRGSPTSYRGSPTSSTGSPTSSGGSPGSSPPGTWLTVPSCTIRHSPLSPRLTRASKSSPALRSRSRSFPSSPCFSRMSSPRLLKRIGRGNSLRPLKVLLLGQSAVGKTALTVRFITCRFIGEYDPTLERKYTFPTEVDGEPALFEVFDTAGQMEDSLHLQENIRWADAYILMYSVTDKCSFNECTRLKFLINHCRTSRRTGANSAASSASVPPVVMVGNKNDLERDRMVSFQDGQKLADELRCARFHEISVRESYPEVKDLFDDVHFLCKNSGRKAGSAMGKSLSPPMLCREDSFGGLGASLEDKTSGSDSDVATSATAKQQKQSIPRRLMRRVFKQDSYLQRGLDL